MSVYVGIHNNGALCYLISVIQQLYFMHDFKEVIMNTNSDNEKAQALIVNLRSLFIAMDHQQDIDDIQCEPIFNHLYPNLADGIYTQKDASEFLSDLIRSTGLSEHLKGTLTGQLVNTLSTEDDGSGVKRHLARPEKFLFTSLTVNCPDGINNLEASLQDFTKTENIQFRWLQQANSVPSVPLGPASTQKQTMFQTLPKHLTFHLKRFKFNVATMKKEKLHHRFEFPNELDMGPYIAQTNALSEQNTDMESTADLTIGQSNSTISYRYHLSGVVVHKGKSAYRGHYYSFVRERRPSPTSDLSNVRTPSKAEETSVIADLTNVTDRMQSIALVEQALHAAPTVSPADRWFLFDDFDVMPFDPAYLDVECFGGPRVQKYNNYSHSRSSSSCSSSSSSSNSSKSCESKKSNNSAGMSHSGQKSSGSVQNESETGTGLELTIDHASTDEPATECVVSISGDTDVVAACAECSEECSASPEKANESENGDADSVASSCGNENSTNDDESCSNNSSDDSDSSCDSSCDDSSSYSSNSDEESDNSDESESESDSCCDEEEGSYIPTRGKFKSAFLLFYDRIDA